MCFGRLNATVAMARVWRAGVAAVGLAAVLGVGVAGVLVAPREAGAALPEVVGRYVDEATLIVGRIDLRELRSEAMADFMADLLRVAPEREREEMLDGVRRGLEGMEEGLAPLRELGVTTAWFVMDPASFMQQQGALTIVPVEGDEQAQAVTDTLSRGRATHRRVEGAVLIGTRGALESARTVEPVERPVLERAFGRMRGTAALQMVMEPTPLVRFGLNLGAPEIARQMRLPLEVVELAGTLEALNFVMVLPPGPRTALLIDFPDEASAGHAQEVLAGQVERLELLLRRAGLDDQQARELMEAFKPEANERRVVVELTPQEIHQTVGPVMVTTMIRGREGAQRVRAGRNLRLLTQAILLWSYEHGEGRLPPELGVVEQVFTDPEVDGTTWQDVQRNPRYGVGDAFAYVRVADRLDQIAEPDITVIAYEKPPAAGYRDGVHVAFADGHVQWLEAADFEELARRQGFEIQRLGTGW